LHELSTNIHVQERLREEVAKKIAAHGGQLVYEAVNEMTYLDAVVSETLRRYPVLPFLRKTCTKRYSYHCPEKPDFKEMTLTIEPGDKLTIPLYGMAMDPQYFEEPEKFDPERFVGEKKTNAYKYVYMPFGEGPRSCLGRRFGVLQIKVATASIVQNFEIRFNNQTKLPLVFNPNYFLPSPIGGMWANFRKIKK